MTFDPATDLSSILADLQATGLGVEVIYGSNDPVNGSWDEDWEQTQLMEGLRAGATARAVQVPTDALSGLAKSTPVTVAGTVYTLRDWHRASADGLMTRLILVTL